MIIQPQMISNEITLEKYAKGKEKSAEDIFKRVAKGLALHEADPSHWEARFLNNFRAGALGAGRIMSSAGTDIEATLINCFVQPMIDDSMTGIFASLAQAAETMRRGGGVGYNFSKLRPKGALVRSTQSRSSGPCAYLDVFDATCQTVESAGARRGAQMGILNINHPDILEFVEAKSKPGRWSNFNVSVWVSRAFMSMMQKDKPWELVHEAEPCATFKAEHGSYQRSDGLWVYRTISATELWKKILRLTYETAEPGILFGDVINEQNNLYYTEVIEATNPCGEEPLPAYGCCDLGPIVLPRFVRAPFTRDARFDFDALAEVIPTHVRMLDNVLDCTLWPLEEQRQEAISKRRIGCGFTGLGNTLAMLGYPYDSKAGLQHAGNIARFYRDACYKASVNLAKERGPFPLFEPVRYGRSQFVSRLPKDLRDQIKGHGIRNSHLLSIAPVGTVSIAFADNASNGIEPPFGLVYERKKKALDGSTQSYVVYDHSFRVYLAMKGIQTDELSLSQAQSLAEQAQKETAIRTALRLSVRDHLDMVATIQPFIDSAISKTVNVPAEYSFEDFARIYDYAYKSGLKGVSAYRPNATRGAVLEELPKEVPESPAAVVHVERVEQIEMQAPAVTSQLPDLDPLSVPLSKRPMGDLEAVTRKVHYLTPGGDVSVYVSVSFADVSGVKLGLPVTVRRPIEVFITANPDGVPTEWVSAYARNLSLLARSGLEQLARALRDNCKVRSDQGRIRYGEYIKPDGSKVPRFHESSVATIAFAIQEILRSRGLLDESGMVSSCVKTSSITSEISSAYPKAEIVEEVTQKVLPGNRCPECGAHAVVKRDGCEMCTNCGAIGSCG